MEGSLSLRNVWLSYPRGRRHVVQVLMDVSLDVHAGEVVAVLAQRAQGKTSLLRVAAGMERPNRGSVLFAGEDLWRSANAHGRRGRRRRRRPRPLKAPIALVRPAPPDVDVPVGEGIALPLSGTHTGRRARELAGRALEEVGAGECAPRRWSDLSDGERARVAIAQGIARDPRVLLIDDLTATLGLGDTEDVVMLLHSLAASRGLGVLMGAGDVRATRWSERIATLAGGELILEPARSEAPASAYPNVVNFPGG
ncbi:MAG TPA: ABC transporter ATP-binding protein [Solirubrobacteraceae bacterium]|jgi:ABC-type cobalamin/Fe3+-siderophores transport system ATPase subunit|nr:ABC transporter ATP-binding protein [Solirubrobacteraceae bacterium]